MNITVNTSLNVIAKSVDTIADISREFTDGTPAARGRRGQG